MSPQEAEAELQRYLRLATFPVGIKLYQRAAELPPEAKSPTRDLHIQVASCQTIGMARRYGWSIGLTAGDHCCAPGMMVLGFGAGKAQQFFEAGNVCRAMYTESAEAGARTEATIDRFRHGEYEALWIAPLSKMTADPDVAVIYGNSAQVMRLVQGALWKEGGALTSITAGRLDCSQEIVRPLLTGECQYILPCTGDRTIALTADDEMAFSAPWSRLPEVIEGLAQTHKHGIRYPTTPGYLKHTPDFPKTYDPLLELIRSEE
ncbi:MAG: DUF169 domain-containing protein [Chloroflexota bacterium]|nr:DUF169 domain-containing protein [Chloroflexota bacterium]